MATQPSASVSVTVSSGDAGAVSVPSQALVFTTGNWSTAQSVSVGGVDDDDALDPGSLTISENGSGTFEVSLATQP